MDRRQFLARLVAAGAAGTLAACGSGSDRDEGGGEPGATTTAPTDPPGPGLQSDPFTLGVASGDVAVRWEVAGDDGFTSVVAWGDAEATAALGHSVHVDVTGLEPATAYRYRFRVGEFTSAVGTARTSPAEGDTADELRIAVASCQDIQVGYDAAHRSIAEYGPNPDALRPVPGGKCLTLADYLTYAELVHRGYARCTITPERWTTEFVIVGDARDPASDVNVAATVYADQGTRSLTLA